MELASSIPAHLVKVHPLGKEHHDRDRPPPRRDRLGDELPFTPACAGLTSASSGWCVSARLYPRVRGADTRKPTGQVSWPPLPPHVRG